MTHATERFQKPGVRVARPVAGPTEAVRNLTFERQIAYLTRQKAEALSKIPATDTVVVTSPKLKNGRPVLDSDGFPELVEKKRLRRDVVAEEFDSRIAAHRKACGLE
jgi:hypothetical protein